MAITRTPSTLIKVLQPRLSPDAHRRAGDRFRDDKCWSEAAAEYAEYLKRVQKDVPIRVQLGNCLKEAGRLAEALEAYELAISLDQQHEDAYVQRTHVLQLIAEAADSFRHAGDRERDSRRWSEAAYQYSEYLKHDPKNVAIRVQLGNCLKEDGQLREALEAYNVAVSSDEADADAYLQRGHLHKIMGRKSDAVSDYCKSFALKPQRNPAFDELLALDALHEIGRTQPAAKPVANSVGTIYIDFSDVMEYLRHNTSLSGIQRVVANLLCFAESFASSANGSPVRAVLPDYATSEVFEVKKGIAEGLIGLATSKAVDRQTIDRALGAVLAARSLVKLKAGDTLLIPGAFWIYQRYDLLNTLRQNGVLVTVFIHDLIQITDPQFVANSATRDFRRSIVDVLCVASYIMTNSNFVAEEVRRYVKERLNFELAVTPVTLATELGMENLDTSIVHQDYVDLAAEEYVLCVGTIEIRKNHLYLVKIWERLIQEFDGAVPNLVFVGKWGWQIEELQKHLAGSDYLGGRWLFIYNGISDNDLVFLYQNCMFTIYPSFAEGWGLPVGESLAYGKPCIASNTTSMPEVGGNFCRYCDPYDLEDGYRVISGVLADRPALAAWAAKIDAEFTAKSWKDFATDLFETVQRYARVKTLNPPGNNVILESAAIATFGNDPLVQLDSMKKPLLTARMSRMSGWHSLEAWGCWAAKRRASLRIKTRMAHGVDVIIYLHLKTPDEDESADCRVIVNGTSTFIDALGSVPTWWMAPGTIGEDGFVDILIISGKGFFHRSGRELFVGILGIAVVAADDAEGKSRLLESIVRWGVPVSKHGALANT